jgi:hypothetical protein
MPDGETYETEGLMNTASQALKTLLSLPTAPPPPETVPPVWGL